MLETRPRRETETAVPAAEKMIAYVINLRRTPERWQPLEKHFAETSIPVRRVEAIDGRELAFPHADFAAAQYRWRHGRESNPGEVGCYLSHIQAMRAFLQTSAPHALICEDDISFGAEFEATLVEAFAYADQWNVLRLSGLSSGKPVELATLGGAYSLCLSFGRLKGTGAYVVDRRAARTLVAQLLPMWLPYDHALDRAFIYNLKTLSVLPYPVSQSDSHFPSSIQYPSGRPLNRRARWLGTYPYQALNETRRWIARAGAYCTFRRPVLGEKSG